MAAIYSVTYSVGQTVLAVPLQTGGDQFAPLPFTGATSGVTTTTHYETIAIPVASQSSSQYVVSSAGRNTTLLKAGQGVYTVSVIQPVIALSTTSVTQSAAGLGTTTGAPASGVGSSSISSQAPTSATGNDLVGGSNDQNLGSNDQKPGSNGRNPGSNNIAAIAAAGVMGGLFVIALGALLFLIFKLRKCYLISHSLWPILRYTGLTIIIFEKKKQLQNTLSTLHQR
ncbi:hypothetical protein L873DRAFT_635862 [Choiromyces venosus 120613-1]|uniref:Uncharacterized protein n=1 Tax=Choiromyces venosus 120613-1 TaxID=1336337 RepID=A0A3N4JTU3_9PEZI|nr:hypothetical protein L873DRAFT_635862 [Choiromyces venosus 120613-1]